MEYWILGTMAAGLAAIIAGLWLAWPPLALLFAGLVLCMISIAAYGKEKR
jgi:hypothetical protein